MDATTYQVLAARTLIDHPGFDIPDREIMIIWNAIGLAGEAGEVADLVKKGIFHKHGLDREKLIKELGDVLWYVAALCSKLDVSMGNVMHQNITKLRERYPNGYTSSDSQQRVDVLGETVIAPILSEHNAAIEDAAGWVESLEYDRAFLNDLIAVEQLPAGQVVPQILALIARQIRSRAHTAEVSHDG